MLRGLRERSAVKGLIAALGLAVAASAPVAQAGLLNGDFADGFDNWLGEVWGLDPSFSAYLLDSGFTLPSSYTSNYSIDSGAAALTTSTADDGIWSVSLYQLFTLDAIAPGSRLWLSYELQADLSDPDFGDTFYAHLYDPLDSSAFIDLRGHSRMDITALAGRQVELLFTIEDFDDSADSLRIANLSIRAESVPVPTPLALIGIGALAALRRPRR